MNILSPCVRKCCLNEYDICLGCRRSLEEIKQWSEATDERKLEILRNAQLRCSTLNRQSDATYF